MRRTTTASVLLLVAIVSVQGCTRSAASPSPAASTPAGSSSARPPTSPSPSGIVAPSSPPGQINVARIDVARAEATDQDAVSAARAINAFGFDLHRVLARKGGNVVFSPTSIAVALGMVRAGARGETARQMDEVLRSVAAEDHANWLNSLDQALEARSGTFEDDEGTEHELVLDVTNAYFAQRDYAFLESFLEAIATRFGAGINLVDFVADTEAARALINAWAKEQTRDRIPEVLKPGDVSADTRLALVNAIYLKAPWQRPFRVDQTAAEPFTKADGSTTDVPTMHHSTGVSCATADGWGAMNLPYVGNTLSMLVIVPDDLVALEGALHADLIASIDRAFATQEAVPDVSLPKFDFETRQDLVAILGPLGMRDALDASRADFSGMTTHDRLFIGKVIHQANISVDEKGTEAAAVTVVGMDTGGGPTDTCTVHANRPFLFAIRDRETGAILFMGRVADPLAND